MFSMQRSCKLAQNSIFKAFYFESGYIGRGFHALNIENCDSISDSLDFLSPSMD